MFFLLLLCTMVLPTCVSSAFSPLPSPSSSSPVASTAPAPGTVGGVFPASSDAASPSVTRAAPVAHRARTHGTFFLRDSAMRYVTVAPRAYLFPILRALEGDLSRCFCRVYFGGGAATPAGGNVTSFSDDDKSCSVHLVHVVVKFNNDPAQLAAYFNAVATGPASGRPPASPMTLPAVCFSGLQVSLRNITRRRNQTTFERHVVFIERTPQDILDDPRDSALVTSHSCGATCGMILATVALCVLMIVATVLHMTCGGKHRGGAGLGYREWVGGAGRQRVGKGE